MEDEEIKKQQYVFLFSFLSHLVSYQSLSPPFYQFNKRHLSAARPPRYFWVIAGFVLLFALAGPAVDAYLACMWFALYNEMLAKSPL